MDESKIVHTMISLYCRKHHGQVMCPDCQSLYDYTVKRGKTCPRKSVKTFCASCPIRCYPKDKQVAIRTVMQFSGPRMLFYHPNIALYHLFDTIKHRITR